MRGARRATPRSATIAIRRAGPRASRSRQSALASVRGEAGRLPGRLHCGSVSLWRRLGITDEDGTVDLADLVRTGVRVLLAAAVAGAAFRGQWLNALLVLAIFGLTLLPRLLGRRFPVQVPHEFGVLTVLFFVASLFLGEIRGYYARSWWWDLFLHAASGFLLGVMGFLLVYLLDEDPKVRSTCAHGSSRSSPSPSR